MTHGRVLSSKFDPHRLVCPRHLRRASQISARGLCRDLLCQLLRSRCRPPAISATGPVPVPWSSPPVSECVPVITTVPCRPPQSEPSHARSFSNPSATFPCLSSKFAPLYDRPPTYYLAFSTLLHDPEPVHLVSSRPLFSVAHRVSYIAFALKVIPHTHIRHYDTGHPSFQIPIPIRNPQVYLKLTFVRGRPTRLRSISLSLCAS